MKALAGLLCMALAGCASWSRETLIEETTFQAISAIDTYETVRRGRCSEADGTWLHAIAGSQPKPGAVIAYGIVRGAGHAYVTGVMEANNVDPWWKRLWQGIGIGIEARSLSINWQQPCR